MEIPEKLTRVIDVQRLSDFLALNQYLDLAILHDGVVNLLAFLRTHVANVLRGDLRGVEDIVAQDGVYEGHDKGDLGRLFRLDCRALLADFGG
ncbi:hypothetical protein D3C85_1467160 [compost metagenome]